MSDDLSSISDSIERMGYSADDVFRVNAVDRDTGSGGDGGGYEPQGKRKKSKGDDTVSLSDSVQSGVVEEEEDPDDKDDGHTGDNVIVVA